MKFPDDFIDKIICGDCLEVMKDMPDESINLIIADPPYNIGKDTWDKIPNYHEWMGKSFKAFEKILKKNGSLYWFHNNFDMVTDLCGWLKNNTQLIFKNLVIWDKYTKFRTMQANGGPLCGTLQSNKLRKYKQFAEYILFYTFQDESGLKRVYDTADCFKSIKQYLRNERKKTGLTIFELNRLLGIKIADGIAKRYFGDSEWSLPTKEKYELLQTTGHFQRSHEDLQKEYKNLRYTFNCSKDDFMATVWHFPYARNEQHIAQKPIDLIENIVSHSSNENDLILDAFVGSGTTAIACKNLKRNFIGIEINPDYCKIAEERLAQGVL